MVSRDASLVTLTFYLFKKYMYFALFGCTGSLTVSSVAAGGGCLLVAVRGLLTAAAPLVEEQGLWGTWVQ